MKGAVTSVMLMIIVTALTIIIITMTLPSMKEMTFVRNCMININDQVRNIVNAACIMDDTDLESVQEVDLSCFEYISYDNTEHTLSYRIKGKNDDKKIDLVCPNTISAVEFDFSSAGNQNILQITKTKYNFLVLPKKAKLLFCYGDVTQCINLNENQCKVQLGCLYDSNSNTCTGTAIDCENLNENQCTKQLGCGLVV
ncbi:MAG: hypothetical protein QXM68_03530 [Candidatus Aenigmatarchaeota archaeon]|nr:hypothetical protein [Candidatus Aenigmarchaeota archaeon]